MRTLEKLTITGFKSVREQALELGPLNVFSTGEVDEYWLEQLVDSGCGSGSNQVLN